MKKNEVHVNADDNVIYIPVTFGDTDSFLTLDFGTKENSNHFVEHIESMNNQWKAFLSEGYIAMTNNTNVNCSDLITNILRQGVKINTNKLKIEMKIYDEEHGIVDRFDETQDTMEKSITLQADGTVRFTYDIYDPYEGLMRNDAEIDVDELIKHINKLKNDNLSEHNSMSM